jgi:hypothetical protein
MKKLIAAGLLSLALGWSGAASAQSAPAAAAAAPAAGFTLDTPIEQIAADPAGKAVLDKDLPGLTTHQAYDQFKGMSLSQVQPMSQGAISDVALAKAGADLAALAPAAPAK